MKTLLESYYGVDEGPGVDSGNASNLDSANFNPETFVKAQLSSAGFSELLKNDDEMVQEIRTLDADMQLLVYDNYSKFISATDTIRSMKSKVDEIESEMSTLVSKVDKIQVSAVDINDRMYPKRSKIEKLVRLQNLIRKLNFLFELPLRLKQCIEMDAPGQAVFYYTRAIPILQGHREVASFASIEHESMEIMSSLRGSLRKQVRNADTDASKFNESMTLLLKLSKMVDVEQTEDCCQLSDDFISWHENDFKRRVDEIKRDQSKMSLEDFVKRMCSNVLDALAENCKLYTELFVDTEAKDEDEENNRTVFRISLEEFAKPVVNSFLATIRDRVVEDDVSFHQESERRIGNGDAADEDDDEDAVTEDEEEYHPLLGALNTLIFRVKKVDIGSFVKLPGTLADRTTEIVEHAIRKQVILAFEILRERVTDQIKELYAQCEGEDVTSVLDLVAGFSSAMEKDMATTMSELDTLVESASDILEDMSAIFDNLIKFQLRHWVLWLANALECSCDPYNPQRISPGNEGQLTLGNDKSERAKIMVHMPVHFTTNPTFVLVLVCVAQEFKLSLRKSPYTVAGLTELLSELDSTKDRLLVKYVEFWGRKICKEMRLSMHQPPTNWTGMEEPKKVRDIAINIIKAIVDLKKQVKTCTNEPDTPSDEATPPAPPAQQNRYRRHNSQSQSNVHLDIERIFSQKYQIIDTVAFTSDAVAIGVLKIVLKTMFENMRQSTFSTHGFQQVEVDTFFLRSILPVIVEDTSVISSLLTQIMTACRDRCFEPVPADQANIEKYCRVARENLQISL